MRIIATICAALALVSCATQGGPREQRARILGKPVANPSAVVAAELSFARLAQEKGQWTAFRETAADDAVMFTPTLVNAQQWLKGKADPEKAVEWQPHKIYMSCDGSVGVSTGAWQAANGNSGYFTTVWRQENFGRRLKGRGNDKETEWKWVYDDGQPLKEPLPEPDFVETKVASCKAKAPSSFPPLGLTKTGKADASADRTLIWNANGKADGSRIMFVDLLADDGSYVRVIENKVAASKK